MSDAPRSPAPPSIRRAARADVPRILEIVAAGVPPGYERPAPPTVTELAGADAAFTEIDASANHALLVAQDDEAAGQVLGVAHLVTHRELTHGGGQVAELAALFVSPEARGRGAGAALVARAIDEARARGCRHVYLISNAARVDAHRFYTRLGFAASHAGFRLALR